MNTALARIAVFVLGLAVVFAGGLAVGSAVGPETEPVAGHDGSDGHASPDADALQGSEHGSGHGAERGGGRGGSPPLGSMTAFRHTSG